MLYTLLHFSVITILTDDSKFGIVLIALLVSIVGPFAGTYMFMKNASKIFGAVAGGVSKAGAGARKWAGGWAKEKQQNSQFAQARAYKKAVKDANRVDRQGKMEGKSPIAAYNKIMSYSAGARNAAKYRRSATNKAAAYNDKIFREDTDSAAAKFEARGIQGPRMVAIAASGRDEDGRKLTTAEHAAAIEWTMNNGKLSERMQVYGSDWAKSGDKNEDQHRLLQTARAGYFKKGDNQYMGVSYAGLLAKGEAGGVLGVRNAMLSNAVDGKVSAETSLDNDYMKAMVDIYDEVDPTDPEPDRSKKRKLPLVQRERYDQQPDGKGIGPVPVEPKHVDKFRENMRNAAIATLTNENTKGKVREEFRGDLEKLAGLQPGSTSPAAAGPTVTAPGYQQSSSGLLIPRNRP